jgi:hypothetical protein
MVVLGMVVLGLVVLGLVQVPKTCPGGCQLIIIWGGKYDKGTKKKEKR